MQQQQPPSYFFAHIQLFKRETPPPHNQQTFLRKQNTQKIPPQNALRLDEYVFDVEELVEWVKQHAFNLFINPHTASPFSGPCIKTLIQHPKINKIFTCMCDHIQNSQGTNSLLLRTILEYYNHPGEAEQKQYQLAAQKLIQQKNKGAYQNSQEAEHIIGRSKLTSSS